MTQKNRTFNVIPNTVSILYFTATCCFSSVNPSLIDLECPANHVCQILCLKTKLDENYAQYCKSCYIAVFLRNCFTSFCTFCSILCACHSILFIFKTTTLPNQFKIWNCPCIQIFRLWYKSEARSLFLSLTPWTI